MKTRVGQQAAASISKAKNEFINFGGGLDLTSPPINTNPGTLRDTQNWFVDTSQGYERIHGYERVDGRPSPSVAQYATMDVTITSSIVVGDTVTGVTSAATGVVVAVVTTETPNYIVITKITGIFQAAEDLNVSAVKEGETLSLAIVGGAETIELNAQYLNLAADEYRGDITAVTGSGNILGVFVLNDIIYAWRNNVGGTQAELWKTTSSGWSQITFEEEVTFTAGNDLIDDGDTLTQGVVTATIQRYLHRTGIPDVDPPPGTGVGSLVITSRSGGNFIAGAATTTGGGALSLDGAETAITMSSNGRFEVIVENFGGALGSKRAYGCDGVNPAWEFDGTIFAPIHTGMSPNDDPSHIAEHKGHLFLSFGPSAQHSAITIPYNWSPVFGAAELAVGDDITGFSPEGGGQLGGALAIISRNKMNILYGTNVDDWSLTPYRDELGGYEWSIQQIGSTMMVDDRGISSLVTSENYGNFDHSTLSRLIRPWVAEKRTGLVASCISRETSQYRLFFTGGIALYTTLDETKVLGMMPQVLGHNIKCAWSSEMNDGSEIILVGDDNGFVFEMEKGTSFDGDPIEHYFNMHFTHLNNPHINKEFFGGFFEISGGGFSQFDFSYELGYAKTDVPQPSPVLRTIELSSARWDAFTWDAFYWDGRTLVPNEIELAGMGENISLIVRGNSDYHSPVKLSGALIQYRPRVGLRYTSN